MSIGGELKKGLSTIDNPLPKHNTQKEIAKALDWSTGKVAMADIVFKKATPELEEKVLNNEITINQAYQEIKKEEKNQIKLNERDKLAEIGKNKKIEIDFRLGDFEEVFADIPDGSIDCIITDPPYPIEFIECWSKLSRFAKRVLKINGFCIAYSGQMNLPEVIKRMNENLDYYWTFAVYHEGQTQIVNGVNLICRWKPVLIFQNGKKKIQNTFQDYFISEQREKNGHDWQQSKSGVAYLIEMFTKEGDTILEPFAGSGTTIIAAREKKRNIIASEIDEKTFNIAKSLI
jgi:site-specific DNA-methyltransferase (adenine-specific)